MRVIVALTGVLDLVTDASTKHSSYLKCSFGLLLGLILVNEQVCSGL